MFADDVSDFDDFDEDFADEISVWQFFEPSYNTFRAKLDNLRTKLNRNKQIIRDNKVWYVRTLPFEPELISDLPGVALGIKGDQPINSFICRPAGTNNEVEADFEYFAWQNELSLEFVSMSARYYTWSIRWETIQRALEDTSARTAYEDNVVPAQKRFLKAWERTKYQHCISMTLWNGGEVTLKNGRKFPICHEVARTIAKFLDMHPLYKCTDIYERFDDAFVMTVIRPGPRQKITGKRLRDGV